jgi:hypothetical protein
LELYRAALGHRADSRSAGRTASHILGCIQP